MAPGDQVALQRGRLGWLGAHQLARVRSGHRRLQRSDRLEATRQAAVAHEAHGLS